MRGGQDNNQIKEVNKALDIALDEAFGANEVLVCNRLALAAYALVTHIARATNWTSNGSAEIEPMEGSFEYDL